MHPVIDRGTQRIYRFSNGYGASVIRNHFSYGGEAGLYELGVLKFAADAADDAGQLDYTTPITDDVLGWLSWSDVEDTLRKIEAL